MSMFEFRYFDAVTGSKYRSYAAPCCTYWCTADGRIVLLTVLRRTSQHDQWKIDRAVRAQELCESEHHGTAAETYERAGVMTGYRTRCVRSPERLDDPERIAIREALVFGKAVYD
jgi:hypothetical protein